MKKEFYIGQPLIVKGNQKKVNLIYSDKDDYKPCLTLIKGKHLRHEYYNYEDLEPSTEFKFSEIIAGLEQGYFEVGTEFRLPNINKMLIVKQGDDGLYLDCWGLLIPVASPYINSTWILIEPRKEMTLEEIETELGYKIKLKDNGGN